MLIANTSKNNRNSVSSLLTLVQLVNDFREMKASEAHKQIDDILTACRKRDRKYQFLGARLEAGDISHELKPDMFVTFILKYREGGDHSIRLFDVRVNKAGEYVGKFTT